jgi:hypothetical protein
MKKETRKLLIFSLQAIVILLVLDFALGKTLSHLYNRMKVGEKARANYFIKKDTSNVIVFGSSRALYHYHSGIVGDSLKLSVYNAGRSNQTILYHTALLKCIVKRHQPKIVILDINEDELVGSSKKYELLSALLPYYKYDEDIQKMYDVANPGYRYFAWLNTLPYNSSLFATIYRGLSGGKDKDIHGFLGHSGKYRDSLRVTDNCRSTYTADSTLMATFNEMIQLCRQHQIKLFVAVSPRYSRYKCSRPEFEALKKFAADRGVMVHDFTETVTDKNLFADPSHLNVKGAERYSMMIGSSIRKWALTN